MLADQQPIQRHPQVLQQVKAVGDLGGLGCPRSCALGNRPATVATDHLHRASSMDAEPIGKGGRLAVREEVEHAMRFEVHEDGPVAGAAAKGEVVDAERVQLMLRVSWFYLSGHLGSADESEQRIAARAGRAQPQPDGPALSGLPAERKTHPFPTALQGKGTALGARGPPRPRVTESVPGAG